MTLPHTPSFRLDGRRALVTGASRGIGFACAAALAEAGAHIVMVARGEKELSDAVAEIQAAGYSAEAARLDITDTAAVAEALPAHGPFDIVCNSAGIARHGPALETRPEDFDAVMEASQALERYLLFVASKLGGSVSYSQVKDDVIFTFNRTEVSW